MTHVYAVIATVWKWIIRLLNVSSLLRLLKPYDVQSVKEPELSRLRKQNNLGTDSNATLVIGNTTSVVDSNNNELAPLYVCRHCEEAKQDHVGVDFKCVFFSSLFDEMTCSNCNAILLVDDAYKLTANDQPTCLACAPRGRNTELLAYFYKDKGL
jgi:sulfur relay (sulfurtransferase) DsrF/TusC family protein